MQRLSSKAVGSNLTESYLYQAGASGTSQTSTLVREKNMTLGGTNNSYFYYTYDSNGNISSVEERLSGETVVYTYDNQNQLLEAEHRNGRTETYTYDTVGNLLTFNNGTTSHAYTYGDSEWKDLLTALDGVTLTYDGLGNPLSYYNGTSYTMSWIEGRKLSSVTVGSGTDAETTVTYQYNADGQRIRKNYSDGSYTQYLIADGRVLAERQYDSSGSVIIQLRYNYDENGTVCGYSTTVGGYPWTDYYFIRNLQGDVVQVFRDSDNAIVAEYSYDSWGNILTATGDQAEVNPFRYRGYYYDEETGFYYVSSRYYDPEIGRFINADKYYSTGQGFVGFNMFVYCNNNPVNMNDAFGTLPEFIEELVDDLSDWVMTPKGLLRYIKKYNGKGKLYENWVDQNNKVQWSRHHTDHGNSKMYPTVPHDHDWYDDDDGNHTQDKTSQPPNAGFHAPESNDNITQMAMDVAATVVVGYIIYTGIKWIVAGLAAPATGGASLFAAGVIP